MSRRLKKSPQVGMMGVGVKGSPPYLIEQWHVFFSLSRIPLLLAEEFDFVQCCGFPQFSRSHELRAMRAGFATCSGLPAGERCEVTSLQAAIEDSGLHHKACCSTVVSSHQQSVWPPMSLKDRHVYACSERGERPAFPGDTERSQLFLLHQVCVSAAVKTVHFQQFGPQCFVQ
jgi:hypothetical protein